MTSIFMPLRSNAAWFGDENTRELLERRIKLNLLIYDRVVFQDGRFTAMAGEAGSYEMFLPVESIDRTKICYLKPGGVFGVEAAGQTVMRSIATVAYAGALEDVPRQVPGWAGQVA